MPTLQRLDDDPAAPFPPLHAAWRRPDGLLAVGGDLSVPRLVNAYRHGCFPWFGPGDPLLWWSPDPRWLLATDALHVPRRLGRWLRGSGWTATFNRHFDAVIEACASVPRAGQQGTWIVAAMIDAYRALHRAGHGHAMAVHDGDGHLVGGIYGVGIGRMFFGESMFSAASNGSRAALLALCRHLAGHGVPLLDCQLHSAHLERLGARPVARADFARIVAGLCATPAQPGTWQPWSGPRPLAALVAPGASAAPEPASRLEASPGGPI